MRVTPVCPAIQARLALWACAVFAVAMSGIGGVARGGTLPVDAAAPPPAAPPGRDRFWPMLHDEAVRQGVPPALADAVAIVETGYTENALGSSGEIGMMQIMPATALQLGFHGTTGALFEPAVNIHYGVAYLAKTWAASGGNACRALMKYRAGLGEERYSPLSLQYCARARAWLRATDVTLATNVAAHTPKLADIADPHAMTADGRPWRRVDLAAFAEIAGMPVSGAAGAAVSRPAEAARQAPRGWRIGGGAKPRIQAVMDVIAGDGDPHVVHVDN